MYSALSELRRHHLFIPGATRFALLSACPWLPYFAPLALRPEPIFKAKTVLKYSRFINI